MERSKSVDNLGLTCCSNLFSFLFSSKQSEELFWSIWMHGNKQWFGHPSLTPSCKRQLSTRQELTETINIGPSQSYNKRECKAVLVLERGRWSCGRCLFGVKNTRRARWNKTKYITKRPRTKKNITKSVRIPHIPVSQLTKPPTLFLWDFRWIAAVFHANSFVLMECPMSGLIG